MKIIEIFTDGGSRGNPGSAGTGVVAYINKVPVYTHSSFIGVATNNVAEYKALIFSLDWVIDKKPDSKLIVWHLDSLLVVSQLNRVWKIKEPNIIKLAAEAFAKLNKIKNLGYECQIKHIPREKNVVADQLVNQALDEVLNPV